MNAEEFNKISTSTKKFFKAIPKDIRENIMFRKELHGYLCTDEKATTAYLALCFLDPCCFFDSALFTFNSQLKHKHWPFILYPHQEPGVRSIKEAIENGQDRFFKKSRKQGATYINLGVLLLYFLISPDEKFLLGSRKESLVDDGSEIKGGAVLGSEETLFFKLLYMINTMPKYMQPPHDALYKKHMFLQNLITGAAFKGEATNLGFGKAFRSRVTLIDEAAQIEPKEAEYIIENIADTSPTSIFNSTPGKWGEAHPYSKLMKEHPDKVIKLSFYDNPTQNYGRYTSPKDGKIRIRDVEYYKNRFPGCYDDVIKNKTYDINELSKAFPFIADGNVSNAGCERTAWLDEFERDRALTYRGKCQNLLMQDIGSTETFFQFGLINKLREEVRKPYYTGDIKYSLDDNGYIYDTWFENGGDDSILSWWEVLSANGRPFQGHNYVIGCDLSKGTGASNSVAAVINVNTGNLDGLLVTPYLSITDFADKVVALCEWVGGNIPPLLIWEENGAPDFMKRIEQLDYYNLFVKEDKSGNKQKSKNKFGWKSTPGPNGTKVEVMNYLDGALHEGLKENPRFAPLHIFDDQIINEMESYVWFEGKIDVGPAAMQTETSGAKASHGDRVIGVAIANYGRRQQPKGNELAGMAYAENSFMARKAERDETEARRRGNEKKWW